ncbi:transporter substrate-binding domain-containing protein [Burkholderia multivorans]|nr:transporter substrate-binding domain-containing protein [Burkholderia multivorans]
MIPRNLMLISVWCGMFSTSLACASSLGLSNDEVRWIESHQVIKYAIDPYWRPIEYRDNKEAAGLTVAYLKEIASNIGVQIQFIETSSWNESITLLAEGKVDLLPGVPDFDIPQSLAAQSQPSPPYFATTTIAVTNAKNRIISGFSDFSIDDTIAIRAGGAYESWIRKKYPNLKIVSFDSTEEALNAVARGQATAVIGPEPILHPVVRQRYSRSLFVAGVIQNLPLVLRMATSTQNPELHSIVQKAISAVSAEQSDRIQEEWVEDADFGQPSITALLRYYGGRIGAIIFVFSATIVALLQAWKARSAISEIAKQRAAFLSIMAHEIRNPLNYILASIELAYAQPDKESARHYIEIAINGSKSLLSLLTTALDYSKISEKNISINKSAATISEILSPILPGFHMEAEKKG